MCPTVRLWSRSKSKTLLPAPHFWSAMGPEARHWICTVMISVAKSVELYDCLSRSSLEDLVG